jgi:hypothetical protein
MFEVHTPKSMKVSDLNPAAYNPRKISLDKFEALKNNIRSEGFLEPIVVQKDGMRIIGGHQRVRAVKEISVEEGEAPPDLPCIVLDISDTRAKKLNIKLNNLQGDFDARMLGELLIDIHEAPTISHDDAINLGFSASEEVLQYMHLIEPPLDVGGGGAEPKTFGRSLTLSLEFSSLQMRDRVKKILVDRSVIEKKKSGDVVAQLLAGNKMHKAMNGRRART